MVVFQYDKTFDGLFCAFFDAYRHKLFPDLLQGYEDIAPLFVETIHRVETTPAKSARVEAGLQKKLPQEALGMLHYAWLSEQSGCDMLLFRYIRKAFEAANSIVFNFTDDDVLSVKKLAKKVSHERHALIQFVRFQKTRDDVYFALVSPDYDVLPLVTAHFVDRFGDQRWALYDERRHYGVYYDLHDVTEITLDDELAVTNGKIREAWLTVGETLYQQLWKGYFSSVSIRERVNPRLQRRHMPKRFWKYLPEKQSGL